MAFGDFMGKLLGKGGDAASQGAAMGGGVGGEARQKIGKNEIRKASETLRKYKSAKSNLENRIVENEQFWKLRQWDVYNGGKREEQGSASAWLWNCIVSKHADFIDAYPAPNCLPRMADDEEEARRLSAVMPIVLDQCDFREVYDDVCYYKLKQGTGVYGVFWDGKKHNGLGDIAIKKIDLLKLFWEPGITDIQDSANVFLVELCDNEVLARTYPQLEGKLGGRDSTVKEYIYDDAVDTSDKSVVVDWYYKVHEGGKETLHYCKFCGDTVLYASENDTEAEVSEQTDPMTGETVQVPGESVSERGWYAHGKYPFVCDTLFKVEGTVAGHGYIDIGKGVLREIDALDLAIVQNARCGAKPRYFIKQNGAVNEKEFADWSRDFIHVNGQNLGHEDIRPVDYQPLQGNYLSVRESKITELKEVTGNRDVNTGGTASGITAASAIAVMQEAGSKQSRDAISKTYNAFKEVCYLCIELMREKYDAPRYFRIMGEGGEAQYVSYSNEGLRPQYQGNEFGIDMGYRTPEFDIEVTAEKASPYKKMERNEIAINMYQLGVFNPQMTDQALLLLDTMDFDGKEQIAEKIRASGTAFDMMMQYQQLAFALAQKYEPETAAIIAQQAQGTAAPLPGGSVSAGAGSSSETRIQNVRNEAQERTQPN